MYYCIWYFFYKGSKFWKVKWASNPCQNGHIPIFLPNLHFVWKWNNWESSLYYLQNESTFWTNITLTKCKMSIRFFSNMAHYNISMNIRSGGYMGYIPPSTTWEQSQRFYSYFIYDNVLNSQIPHMGIWNISLHSLWIIL